MLPPMTSLATTFRRYVPGRQRNRLLIDRLPLGDTPAACSGGLSTVTVSSNTLHHAARHGGDAAVDVDDGLLHAFLGLELQVLIVELHGDVGQDGGFGQREVIRPHLHRQNVEGDASN